MAGTSSPIPVSTKLQSIATLAREDPERVLTTLAHHIDMSFLREAYRRTRKDGAAGVDGQTAQAYAENLEGNLASLLNRFKSGSYYAPPVRRVYIPKDDGKASRPLGIPSFEDKVLQRAVAMVLEAVYEQDFLECSYGFRPKRSAHQALDAFWKQAMLMRGGWVVKRKTASARLSRALKRINTWLRKNRHAKIGWQHQQLAQKLRGHYGYYGMTTNSRCLNQFRRGVIRLWRKWLSRRSQRSQIRWDRFNDLLKSYPLPQAKIVHSALKA